MTVSSEKKKSPLLLVTVLLSASGIGYWMYNAHLKETSVVNASAKKPATMVHLESFVVNLADSDGKDYLRVGIDLSTEGREKENKSEEKVNETPIIRDVIISVLSTRNSEELLTPEGKQKLKDDLIKALNAGPAGSNVREIYFNEFLVQH
jgi:flagellar FliL protein